MSTNRSREMSLSETQAFTNALRECLGLDPLYKRGEFVASESDPWWAPYIGNGNRRVSPRGSAARGGG